jgi:hypothetical protein
MKLWIPIGVIGQDKLRQIRSLETPDCEIIVKLFLWSPFLIDSDVDLEPDFLTTSAKANYLLLGFKVAPKARTTRLYLPFQQLLSIHASAKS